MRYRDTVAQIWRFYGFNTFLLLNFVQIFLWKPRDLCVCIAVRTFSFSLPEKLGLDPRFCVISVLFVFFP